MDADIYQLKVLYLIKARELLLTGQAHKAQILLGISPESAALLKRLSINHLQKLAAVETICFLPRVTHQALREFVASVEAEDVENLKWEMLARNIAGAMSHVE